MKIIEKRLLRGPNLHAAFPCIQVIVDLEALDRTSSAALPGFADRLVALLPTLQRHRCSLGVPGGFVQRLHRGTYMAHILEHVLLELQCQAGSDVGFGRARRIRGMPRCYRVVCQFSIEPLVNAALQDALTIVSATAEGHALDIGAILQRLRRISALHGIGPSTASILKAARARGIPFFRLTDDSSLIQLGQGIRQRRIRATVTERTGLVATDLAGDKQLTRTLLERVGIPVPRGVTVTSPDEAVKAAVKLGGSVVVKPADGNHGRGVTTRVADPDKVAAAYGAAREHSRRIIVERHVEGEDHRILIVDGKMVAAARRSPPHVVGDGVHTIGELVARENANPLRGDGHGKALTRIPVDAHTTEYLRGNGLTLDAVPEPDRMVPLRGNANLSTGGTAEDVTDLVHPGIARTCIRAVRQIGLDVAGVDLVCQDITRPLREQRGAIIEINAAPGIRMHEFPTRGRPRPAGKAIVDSLFPGTQHGRIPVIAVTGTNGKTTTTLLIASVFRKAGYCTGSTTTEGVFIDGERIIKGDCTGYWSARSILASSEVEAAVLETARGGILKRGLGFDRCDVAVVLNVSADHLGLDGIHTMDALARVKAVVALSASKAVVLNASDPYCVAMASELKPSVERIYFCADERHPVLRAHLAAGGRAVYASQGDAIAADRGHATPLFRLAELPITLDGHAAHNIENALAAAAALIAQGDCGADAISAGLRGFSSDSETNPLRMNMYEAGGVTVLLDYAHNPAAYEAVLDTVHAMGFRRILGVISAPANRREEELREVGRICARRLDEILVYENKEFRGRPRGDMASIILEAIHAEAQGAVPARIVLDAPEAIWAAFCRCEPGDLLLIGGATQLHDLQLGLANLPFTPLQPFGESKSA